MISVLDHIEYLSVKHDCVIVPEFGAFISQYAYLKSNDGLINGLRRNTVFNMSINNNDGLLANSIVRREKISYEMAKSEIDNYVKSLRCQLKHEGEVPVGRIGFFKYHQDDTIEFFPFSSWNSNNEFYGLLALNIKPLSQDTSDDTLSQNNRNVVPLIRKFMHIAASIVLLISLVFVLSTPILEENNQNYANLNAFTIKTSVEQELGDLYISIPENIKENEVSAKVTEPQVITNMPAERIKNKGNYCLVIASLATQKQAEKYIEENNLTDYEILKSKTKYRVYIARGTFKDMCDLKASEYAQSDAWVCHI